MRMSEGLGTVSAVRAARPDGGSQMVVGPVGDQSPSEFLSHEIPVVVVE